MFPQALLPYRLDASTEIEKETLSYSQASYSSGQRSYPAGVWIDRAMEHIDSAARAGKAAAGGGVQGSEYGVQGADSANKQMDMYGLGLLLHAILTGTEAATTPAVIPILEQFPEWTRMLTCQVFQFCWLMCLKCIFQTCVSVCSPDLDVFDIRCLGTT